MVVAFLGLASSLRVISEIKPQKRSEDKRNVVTHLETCSAGAEFIAHVDSKLPLGVSAPRQCSACTTWKANADCTPSRRLITTADTASFT